MRLHALLVLFHIVAPVSAIKLTHLRVMIFFQPTCWTILIAQQLLLPESHSLHVLAISLKCAVKIIGFFICFSELLDHVQILHIAVRRHLQILILNVLSLLRHDASVMGLLLLSLFPFGSLDFQPL